MNPRIKSPSHSARHPARSPAPRPAAANQSQTPIAAQPRAPRNRCGLGMGQAFALEEAALASAVCMNSCAMNFCQHVFWYPFGLGSLCDAENLAVASCMDLEMQCLGLLVPHACGCGSHILPTQEELEYGMDVAVEAFDNEILA